MDQTAEINPKTVLVIRKPDRTIHKVPIENKAVLMSMNQHVDPEKQWSIEEMAYDKAMKLPFIDENYVTAGEATELLKEKDDQIAELMAQLEGKTTKEVTLPEEDPRDKLIRELQEQLLAKSLNGNALSVFDAPETANQKIDKIINASTIEEVNSIFDNDTRITVKTAADKKIKQLQQRDNN